jgi:two-component system, OmpR family, response regulator
MMTDPNHAAPGATDHSRTKKTDRSAMRILVVEDDALLAQGLTRVLIRAGHTVDHASTGTDADNALRATSYELVVLDIGLPDIDGFEILRRLRLRRSSTNVLVLTARDAVEDRVHGLDLGADDYLTKPFSLTEFEARVRALLRRKSAPPRAVAVGGLSIDVEAKRITVKDTPVDLTVREWTLLELFLNQPGRVLAKEQIAQQLADVDGHLTLNAVEVYVSRLRAKLESAGVRIRTVRGFGYLWETDDE